MVERTLLIKGRLGLHARAAAKLVRVANGFQSQVRLRRLDSDVTVDAKSILSVLMLAAGRGTELQASADGVDEEAAMIAIEQLFAEDFGEVRTEVSATTQAPQEIRFKGLGVSEGIVIGQVLRMNDGTQRVYQWKVAPADIDAERQRFRAAVSLASRQVLAIKQQAGQRFGREHAYIFDAHLLLLEDEKLIGDVERLINTEHVNAEWAVKVICDRFLYLYSEVKDDYLRERGSDIEDVMRRLLVALSGVRSETRGLTEDAVVVSQDLLPSAVAELDLAHTRALATDTGGWTSHTAILARGVGIPAVVGLRDFYRRTRTGDRVIVDSSRNLVILHPSPATLERYQGETTSRASRRDTGDLKSTGPVQTQDGVEVTLRANVEIPSEFDAVETYGASGVGLYRSEFLLVRRGGLVSEDEQRVAYEAVARVAGEHGAIIRLFDLGADNLREQFQEPEKNSALGLRAIRFALANEPIMREQVRAILRAAANGLLKIVLPMVADVNDVKRAQAIIEDEAKNLREAGVSFAEVSIGAMIEVPSAVLMASRIARIVDFFELGTNDLVQYTLAVDRGNDEVADWFRTLHPAILQSIDQSLKAGRQAGIPVIVCGEMASTPAYVVLLIGLGATDLSMTPSAIPRVRRAIAGIDAESARGIALDCLNCDTADEVETLVRERLTQRWPELFDTSNLPAPRQSQNREW
ncbi:MAG: phosphoenolpyruvate--protein phosphotransferase [Pyrinomonadaceae bacterium]